MNSNAQESQDLRDLYRELILDHARSPRHFGKLDNATHMADGLNPLCGDKLHLYFTIGDEGVIESARFEGSGCAISVASASLLTDAVIGKSQQHAVDLSNLLIASLTGQNDENSPELGKMKALAGVREFPSRVKCATLAWHALNSAINRDKNPVSTE